MESAVFGVVVVILAGLAIGTSPWPIKRMRHFQYEHWAFVAMLTGLIVAPWTLTLVFCPNAIEAYQTVGMSELIKSNLFSMSWGIANILYLLCLVRIGVSLTNGILTGVGVSVGVVLPMVVKGSGAFEDAPDLLSAPGLSVLLGVVVMLLGVLLISIAGLGREKILREGESHSSGFAVGLAMAALAGVLSAGISFAFIYSQGPIVAAMKAQGASDIPANVAVWAAGLLAGAALNVLYPAYLMTKNGSWGTLLKSPVEIVLAMIFGLTFFTGFALMGKGMVLMGAMGASVGFGIYQSMQMLGGQAVGFWGGEWSGVTGKPRRQMILAIVILIVATVIMSYGNALS